MIRNGDGKSFGILKDVAYGGRHILRGDSCAMASAVFQYDGVISPLET